MRIVFIGPPGAGKGTQSVRLAEHLRVPHISTGEILRNVCEEQTDVGRQATELMSAGQLVPDDMVSEIVSRRLAEPDCRSGVILDGFPRTKHQAEFLDRYFAKRGQTLNAALEMKVTQEILLERLSDRGRSDDVIEIVQHRLEQYGVLTQPLLDYYSNQGVLHVIDGLGSTDEVFERICLAAKVS